MSNRLNRTHVAGFCVCVRSLSVPPALRPALRRTIALLLQFLLTSAIACAQEAGLPSPWRLESLATIDTSKGYVSQAAWAGGSNFFSLVVTPEGAEVWRTDYDLPLPEKFISSSFIRDHVCPPAVSSSLRMTVSPSKNFIAFLWQDNGSYEWRLIDISAAPYFKLKRFNPPEGMKISRILISPDDRYAVFVHDAFEQGSTASILVMDLTRGEEYWRISSNELSFINDLWWGNVVLDGNKAFCTAKLIDTHFEDQHHLVNLDFETRTISPGDGGRAVLTGAASIWGHGFCYETEDGESDYALSLSMPGTFEDRQVPLTSLPVQVSLLAEPGLAVVCNSDDGSTAALWLIDANTGDKRLVDSDCAAYDAGPGGMLLVRGANSTQLRVYGLTDTPEFRKPPPPPTDPGAIIVELDPGG